MKIYIVKAPQGEYDSYREPIVKVFADKAKAEEYVKIENAKKSLKQQVREEVVEDFYDEIRHRAILEDDYCPDHNLERKYGVRKCLLENIRTTILKKYGDKNESNND